MADNQLPAPKEHNNIARLVIGVVLLIIVIAFVLDNTRKVKIGYVVGDHQTRLIYVLVITVAIGICLGVLFDRLWMHRGSRR